MLELIQSFVTTAQTNIKREYPNHLHLYLLKENSSCSPKDLHPIFYGCLDWHSSVHNHWLLAKAVRLYPKAGFAKETVKFLQSQLTKEKIQQETKYFLPRLGYERPYGWAWYLALVAELATHPNKDLQALANNLAELEALIVKRFSNYLDSLIFPINSGKHDQTAFAIGLALDYARAINNKDFENKLVQETMSLYVAEVAYGLKQEPSHADFLSPSLSVADLMTRVFKKKDFTLWLDNYWQEFDDIKELKEILLPVNLKNPSDGQAAHFAGLNMSRAWMLRRISKKLPKKDKRKKLLKKLAKKHLKHGLPIAQNEDYMVSHWAPTFAVYELMINKKIKCFLFDMVSNSL